MASLVRWSTTSFGQQVADYNGATMEKENIYRGGQLLAVYEAASTCYKTLADFVTAFYQGALHRNPNTTELSEWTLKLSKGQAQGNSKLIKVAQDLGTTLFTSSEYTNTNHSTYVNDLYAAFLQRSPDSGGYNNWMAALAGGASFTTVRNGFAYSLEFQGNVATLCPGTSSGTSTSANLKYVLTDVQGSGRALMNNGGSGTSTIVARHDYLPFGEEIWSGVGLRTTTQKYATTDKVRRRFAQTERDEATGLDHTWFRKYENFAGRWTSPDPLAGNTTNAQSFNLYAYATNDPVNKIDPSGLRPCVPGEISAECSSNGVGWGWGDISGGNRNFRPGLLTILLRERMFDLAWSRNNRLYSRWLESFGRRWASEFIANPFSGYDPQDPQPPTNCETLRDGAAELSGQSGNDTEFVRALRDRFVEARGQPPSQAFGSTGFKTAFQDSPVNPESPNQVRHYVAILFMVHTLASVDAMFFVPARISYTNSLVAANLRELRNTPGAQADRNLNVVAVRHATKLAYGRLSPTELSAAIRDEVCDNAGGGNR